MTILEINQWFDTSKLPDSPLEWFLTAVAIYAMYYMATADKRNKKK